MKRKTILWEPIVLAFGIMATIVGVVVPLFVHLDNKTTMQVDAIRKDMQDFHQALIRIEEKRK